MPARSLLTALGLSAALLAPAAPVVAQDAPAAEQPAPRIGGTYAFDTDHSHIVFTYDHLGFSTSTGIVRGVTGTVTMDEADPAKSTVEASVPLANLLTVSKSLDAELTGDDLFKGQTPDTAITFRSTEVLPEHDSAAKITGDLTLNGVTKPLTLDVTVTKMGEHPMTKKPALGFEATGTIKRSDFNLGAFAPAVGDDVALTIHVEAQKG